MLQSGNQAPDFIGTTSEGKKIRLSDFIGKKVVLYFYPMDNTIGCTTEACSIRDQWAAFEAADIAVIGVSVDSVKSHQKFIAKYRLPFILVSDPSKEIVDTYDSWRPGGKYLYAKSRLGVKRMTFLIDESGTIIKIFRAPKNSVHGREILDAFAELQ